MPLTVNAAIQRLLRMTAMLVLHDYSPAMNLNVIRRVPDRAREYQMWNPIWK